uniref:Uncharacterized protein n=1 Tax=Anguilla anguilla TaxID=7936 RepID=A0A0E9RC26_ANGAN
MVPSHLFHLLVTESFFILVQCVMHCDLLSVFKSPYISLKLLYMQ